MDDLEKELNPREDMENDDDDADDSCDNSSRKEGSSFKLDLIQPICQSKTHFIFRKSAFSPLILFKKFGFMSICQITPYRLSLIRYFLSKYLQKSLKRLYLS